MPCFDAHLIAQIGKSEWQLQKPNVICGFCIDSRRLKSGELFVALKSYKNDGHDYLAHAKEAGASGALVAQLKQQVPLAQLPVEDPLASLTSLAAQHRRSFKHPIIGITGSCGKTSTKDLLQQLLDRPQTLATSANENNAIGVPLSLLKLDASHRYGVIEVGISARDEMAPLAQCLSPDYSIITCIAPAHLSGLGSLSRIAAEKAVLAHHTSTSGCVSFPAHCLTYPPFRELDRNCLVVAEAHEASCIDLPQGKGQVVRASITFSNGWGQLTLQLGSAAPTTFRVKTLSRGLLSNAALALGLAQVLGVPEAKLHQRLASWQPSPLRGEWRSTGNKHFYVDCYNANPISFVDSIAAFERTAPAALPRLYLLGSMNELGEESEHWHQEAVKDLKLRSNDSVYLLGQYASAFQKGLLSRSQQGATIELIDAKEEVLPILRRFQGAVLLKASRSYALEEILTHL